MTQLSEHPEMLPWYVSGNLEAVERERIRAHLQECAECSQEVRRLESLRQSLRSEQPPHQEAGHAGVEDLVAFESGSAGLDGTARQRLEDHLAVCGDCREDLESLQSASRLMARPGRATPAGARTTVLALAAAVLVAIVGFAAVLMNRQATEARIVLTPGLRSVAQAPALAGAGPWHITVILPFEAPDGTYVMAISLPGGLPLESGLNGPVEARKNRLELTLPPLSEPGVYRISVRALDDSAGPVWDYLFRVGASPSGSSP